MKKINVILLIFSFVLSGIGGIFLFGASATNQNVMPSHAPVEEIMEYTYKTYEDYFIDYDFSNITLSGDGTNDSPYQVNSTEDFLFLIAGQPGYLRVQKHNLPSEYQQVTYLRSTGTQYIDTGVPLKQSIRPSISFSMSVKTSNEVSAIFGAVDNVNNIVCTSALTNKVYASHGAADGAPSVSAQLGLSYNLEFREDGRWYLNDKFFTETKEIASTGTSTLTMWLFGRQFDDGLHQLFTAGELSIHEFKFYDENELIHHYIPCYRKSDIKPGMYDVVTGEFLTNSGTGEFEYGDRDGNINYPTISPSDKHIELNSDIILNDETFDKDGNPTGGDGVVYHFKPISQQGMYLNGKGHKITGLFEINAMGYGEGNYIGLFGYTSRKNQKIIENLSLENVYIYGKNNVVGFAHFADEIKNCHVLSGYIISEGGNAHGIGTAVKTTNCSNYATIIATGNNTNYTAGISSGGDVDSCVNYGDIFGFRYVGGICSKGYQIKNSINHGTVNGANNAGGIAGCPSSAKFYMVNCINYGEITVKNNGAGGFVGIINYDSVIYNCKNFGNAASQSIGSFNIYGYHIKIVDCQFAAPKFSTIYTNNNTKLNTIEVINCQIDLGINTSNIFIFSGANGLNLVLDNIYITGKNVGGNINLINAIAHTGDITIKNVLMNIEGDMQQTTYISSRETSFKNLTVFGFIVKSNSVGRVYYGLDFSGMFYSWKTGKLGLIIIDGRGQFQGKIDEEWLLNNGYEKREI